MFAGDQDRVLHERLREARDGSTDALQSLCAHFGRQVLHVIRRRMSRRIRTIMDAEDFLQDTLLSLVWHKLPAGAFEGPKSFLAYVTRVARNEVGMAERHHLRARKASLAREVALSSPQVKESSLQALLPTASDHYSARYLCMELFRSFSFNQQEVFAWLCDGFSPRQLRKAHFDPTDVRDTVTRVMAEIR